MDDGDFYIGEFKIDSDPPVIQGKGVMIFDDGSFLQGWWLDNKPDGKCRNVLADGTVTEGIFKDWEF